MAIVRSSALRQAVAAILLAVLTLSGIGRSVSLAGEAMHRPAHVSGVTIEICHTDVGGKSAPGAPGRHDCCDACALCAAATLPDAAVLVAPVRVKHFADHAGALTWAPSVARVPTPRQSQGPPAA